MIICTKNPYKKPDFEKLWMDGDIESVEYYIDSVRSAFHEGSINPKMVRHAFNHNCLELVGIGLQMTGIKEIEFEDWSADANPPLSTYQKVHEMIGWIPNADEVTWLAQRGQFDAVYWILIVSPIMCRPSGDQLKQLET